MDEIDLASKAPKDEGLSQEAEIEANIGVSELRFGNASLKGYLMFEGDPAPNSSSSEASKYREDKPSLIEQVKLTAADAAKSFLLDMWLARHTPEKVLPILLKAIEAAKEEFADAVAYGGGIYCVGYCTGAKYTLMLGGELPDALSRGAAPKTEEAATVKNEPLIKAGAIAHGTLIAKEDIERLKIPTTMVCIENDQLFPDDMRNDGQKYLLENGVEHEIRLYSNVPHGKLPFLSRLACIS
ncbi:MAG: hypothetical protein M1829_004960 [Trizodia sp. TS-e1964]|nr:MAG: hypothetical protein M1829_004960 [Trizodia sp. TS-e1964]